MFKSDLEEFNFIDASDLSSTGEDIITVINEEHFREYQKSHSVPERNISVNEAWNSVSAPAQISNCYVGCSSDELSSVCSGDMHLYIFLKSVAKKNDNYLTVSENVKLNVYCRVR